MIASGAGAGCFSLVEGGGSFINDLLIWFRLHTRKSDGDLGEKLGFCNRSCRAVHVYMDLEV